MPLDTVFGIFVTDDLKLVSHRVVRNGIHHRHAITPLDPKPDETVTLHVQTPAKKGFEHIAAYYTTDGSLPAGSQGVATNGNALHFAQSHLEWDTLIWDYLVHWQTTIPGQPNCTMVNYVISAWSDGGDEVYADTPGVDEPVQLATMKHYKSIPADTKLVETGHFFGEEVFNYHVDDDEPPAWAADAVIYQILVDRFSPGEGKMWKQTDNLGGICGGTLWGVCEKLDYLADLGVNCLWLSPTWVSPTYHGYDVTDYDRVEPRYGGDEALRAVISGAHARGIRVLLDMVCNHLSDQHPIFVTAENNTESAFRKWFFFDERVPNGYKSFFGVSSMPRLNLNYPPARDWMVANAVRWLRDFDIDGYRLDVADGPGPNFWSYFRKACREVKPDCLIFGEIVDTPQRLRTYAGRLDGVLDFPLGEAMRHTFALDALSETQLNAFVATNEAYYPAGLVRPTFLDNHDMNRFSMIAQNDPARLKRAAAFHMQLPGPKIIYYGTEIGIKQARSLDEGGYHEIRPLMAWDETQDQDLLAYYKEQIRTRKSRNEKIVKEGGGS
ncbi:MAG: alpha-amylase [Anaerolineales bacterium]|nr:alpha-amylase [Anaerolineales bacterium]